ncbi:hypothetical protein NFJ02_16g24300 [Pycnococcus provasolii]
MTSSGLCAVSSEAGRSASMTSSGLCAVSTEAGRSANMTWSCIVDAITTKTLFVVLHFPVWRARLSRDAGDPPPPHAPREGRPHSQLVSHREYWPFDNSASPKTCLSCRQIQRKCEHNPGARRGACVAFYKELVAHVSMRVPLS